ncbi:MarR family winged helix-turn-helix transcriptional regulator [Streptomyces sp. NPDC052396]|uniref:MarR family winged helix-turn-helix transcriptional regulator n=1 Tax=Streptomyces sp. NPDC052396 TaxID=3365689 RepID=UPI0037D4C77C
MTTHDEAALRAWSNLRELVLGGNERRKEVVEALGMSFFRIKALRRVAKGPIALCDLADELLTDRPYTTLVVDDLTQRGLVQRTANPADRRSKIVTVTEAGREAAQRAESILCAPPPALLALPEEELAELERISARLVGTSAPTPLSPPGE